MFAPIAGSCRGLAAPDAAALPPESETARVASASRFEGGDEKSERNCPSRESWPQRVTSACAGPAGGARELIDRKTRATLTARACLAGVVLRFVEDDRGNVLAIATRWGWTRQMRSVAEVDALLRRLELAGSRR